jgi:hypothetical protein
VIRLGFLPLRARGLRGSFRCPAPPEAKLRHRLVHTLAPRNSAWRVGRLRTVFARGLRRQLVDELCSLQLSLRIDIELGIARARQGLETVVCRLDQVLRALQELTRFLVV